MKQPKRFDCIVMKDTIQKQLAEKYANMTPLEHCRAVEEWLDTSDDIVARKWRSFKPALAHADR